MKKRDPSFSFFALNSLCYKYKCVNCGAYIKKGDLECYRCGHEFSNDDVEKMISYYKVSSTGNGHHIIFFVLFMAFVLGILLIS